MNNNDTSILNVAINTAPLFSGLTEKQREDLRGMLSIEKFNAGDFIVHEGDVADKVYIILEGDAEVLQNDQYLATLDVYDTIGDLALIDHQHRSADVKATSPILLACFELSALKVNAQTEVPLETALKLNCAIKVSNYLRGSNLKSLNDRKKHRSEIAQLTNYDVVTGLPNQHYFSEKLEEILSSNSHHSHVLLQIELVEFKEISDAMGVDFADEFLNEFANKLDTVIPANTLTARVGKNQFMLLIPSITDLSAISHVAKKILNVMISPMFVREEEVYINGYIGISHYPEDGKTATVLMKHAGLALDAAKLGEPNCFSFYDESLNAAVERRRKLIKDFRVAVEQDQFELYYQPQVALDNGSLIGAEALIRWPHPTQGMIPPSTFIPIVEQSGLIIALGNWILRTACAQIHMWGNAKLSVMPRIAINLSALQLKQKEFVPMIKNIIDTSRINPSMIELEITESVMMRDMDDSIAKVKELADLGFMIAIDDFGTGYSSLSYLRRLPIHKLKIDQSFVRDLFVSSEAQDIVRCIVLLAKSLKLITLAEGIETKEQRDFLKMVGCQEGQGYLFSQPISTGKFEQDFLLNKG